MAGGIPVIVLFGPTAVGKTDILFSLFPEKGEVVSADSMQVYRGMDIGTAKPSWDDRLRLPHHLVDIRNPEEQFSVGEFVRCADICVRDIASRGRIPIVSGGTAFYLKNFLYGLAGAPESDDAVRDAVFRDYQVRGLQALRQELSVCDPVTASRISENDTYRILRAVEVFRQTGKPLSSFVLSTTIRPELDPLIIGLDRDRAELYGRIDARVATMFDRGLVEEVKGFMRRGYTGTEPGMKAIGYREFFLMRESGCQTVETICHMIRTNSRRYAKRQLTFFRRLSGVRWFHPANVDELSSCVNAFIADRSRSGPS